MTTGTLPGDVGIVDAIYEAALDPDLWPAALERLAAISATFGGALTILPSAVAPWRALIAPQPRWTTTASVETVFAAFHAEGWMTRCDWVGRARQRLHPGFVAEDDLFAPGEYALLPSSRFWGSHGIRWSTALFALAPSGDRFSFAFERRREDGPIGRDTLRRLDELRPHLCRAALIACRLGLERANAVAQALALLGLPAAVLGPDQRLVAINELMRERMPRQAEERAFGRFHLADKGADALLTEALVRSHQTAVRPGEADVFSIPMPASADSGPTVAHVVPVVRSARDVFAAADNLVILTPVTSRELPADSVIRGLFDLTAAETRIARMIAGGATVAAIAADSRTTEGTVRTQLKGIFAKTGVSRQAELVALLAATALRTALQRPTG